MCSRKRKHPPDKPGAFGGLAPTASHNVTIDAADTAAIDSPLVLSLVDLVSSRPCHNQNRSNMSTRTVVFICTANYYRSRFCELWFNAQAEARGLNWRATSRGLRTWMADGYGPIASYTVERLAARGIHLNGNVRFPISLSESDLKNADLVVALKEEEHRAMMAEQFPAWADRIEYWHVHDIDCATADESLPLCETHVDALVRRLETAKTKSPPAVRLPEGRVDAQSLRP